MAQIHSLPNIKDSFPSIQASFPSTKDSFPGMETMQPLSQPVPSNTSSISTANQLKSPPKWLRKPCGAKFGFGGKLVTFDFDSSNAQPENQSAQPNQQSQNTLQKHSGVFVSKVVTEPDLVQKSLQLEHLFQIVMG